MKRLLNFVVSAMLVLTLCWAAPVCSAGDVPEALLHASQVYFGEVKEVDGESITVIQRINIKGEFTRGSELTYDDFAFTESPEAGVIYLCGYLDDNNPLYIWEVTSLEPRELKIKKTDDMSQRMQDYLNSGQFEEKEKK